MANQTRESVVQPILRSRPLRVGFVPLSDCAPLVMAQELGLYAKYGLRVRLSREAGWATVRDKIIYGELDAAHALAPMVFAASLGLGSVRTDCVTALVLSLNGNAITLSRSLFDVVRSASLAALERRKPLVFGIPFTFSSHHFLLRAWLRSQGLASGSNVQMVVVPPPQMETNLRAGHLDGFCVGEPWNSVAVRAETGWCAATSVDLDWGHPEKVLMVRRDFADECGEEHAALVAALLEACEFCDAPEHREDVIAALSSPRYVGVPKPILHAGLQGPFDFGHGTVRTVAGFCTFHGYNANEPSADKAAWILQYFNESGLCPDRSALNAIFGQHVFRADIFEKALRLRQSIKPQHELKHRITQPNFV